MASLPIAQAIGSSFFGQLGNNVVAGVPTGSFTFTAADTFTRLRFLAPDMTVGMTGSFTISIA